MDFYKNENLICEMKNYIYESKFCTPNFKIYSKNYLTGVLFNEYSNNSNVPLYSFLYGDFNKLGKLNQIYGINTVDNILFQSLKLIGSILPENAKIARIAGDEFAIILDGINKHVSQEYINKISQTFENHSEILHGLSISLAATDSNDFTSISDMYFNCENKVAKLKHDSISQKGEDIFQSLESKINTSFSNFWDYYRLPSSFKISKQKKEELEQGIISILSDQLEISPYNQTTTISKISNIPVLTTLSQRDATLLDRIFSTNIINDDNIENLNFNSLQSLFNYLTRETTSGEFSKKYFLEYLLPIFSQTPEQKINISAFYLTHLKLSNEVTNHVVTDDKMMQMHHNLCSELRQYHCYEENIFTCKNNSNYLIQYGPNIISILRNESELSANQIEHLLKKAREGQNILNLIALQATCNSNTEQILSTIRNLKEISIQEKDDIKIAKFNHPNSKIALESAISNAIQYYKDNVPDWTNINQKRRFLDLFMRSFTNTISEKYQEELEL